MVNEDYERLSEERESHLIEEEMRRDFDFALKQLSLDSSVTVKQFAHGLKKLSGLGWDITADELLEAIKD